MRGPGGEKNTYIYNINVLWNWLTYQLDEIQNGLAHEFPPESFLFLFV